MFTLTLLHNLPRRGKAYRAGDVPARAARACLKPRQTALSGHARLCRRQIALKIKYGIKAERCLSFSGS
jgi:hypothetical protein